jgi:hypothetical protein
MNQRVVAFPGGTKDLPDSVLALLDAGAWDALAEVLEQGFPIGLRSLGDVDLFERVLAELEWQRPPYRTASQVGPRRLLDAFLAQGLPKGALYSEGATAVALAAMYGQWDWMHVLLELGYETESALEVACSSLHGLIDGRLERRMESRNIEWLEEATLEEPEDVPGVVRFPRVRREKPEPHAPRLCLLQADEEEEFHRVSEAVEALLAHGASVEARALDDDGETAGWPPLIQAVWCLDRAALQGFLGQRALLSATAECGPLVGRALEIAIHKGDAKMVEDLLDAGAPVDADPRLPASQALQNHPLVRAASSGRPLLVELVAERMSAEDIAKFGPLGMHLAAATGQLRCMRTLRKLGVSYGAKTALRGFTPLHQAAFRGQAKTLRFLSRCGQRWETPNDLGQSAADLLWQTHPELARTMNTPAPVRAGVVRALLPRRASPA